MNINKNQFEILSFIENKGGIKLTQRFISDETNLSLGVVNKTLGELNNLRLISSDYNITKITKYGLEVLEPYRVKRVIIIAAGFGSRMVPITLNTPKPLVRVHGVMIIETLLDAIVTAGITEIVIVRGYLWEQFDSLIHKYPNITFIYNPLFNDSNNISSTLLAKDLFENAYLMEADLVLNKPSLVRKYEYSSNYLGMYTDYTDDWCFNVKNGLIKSLSVGGTNCYHMFGISYWNKEDGKKLSKYIEEAYNLPGGKERYWDEVPLRIFSKDFQVAIRPCLSGDVIEIDSFTELKEIDPIYNV